MKATKFFKPVSVTVSQFPLKRHHIIFVISRTPTHTRIGHLQDFYGKSKMAPSRTITNAQFKNGYNPMKISEVLQIVEE